MSDPSDFSHPRQWDRDRCTGCLRIRHVASAIELYDATPAGTTVPGHKLPKLDPNGICPTLRAGSDSTHGSHTAPRPVHPVQPRCITAREAARLHGFPDWFAFYPMKWHAYRQIGNSVCPPVARAIGLGVMEAFGIAPSKPVDALQLGNRFDLPDDRPRTLKRIPIVDNYPPVIAHLFAAAYDEEKQRLRKSRFTFRDVEEAIRATGVNLHWTRADTFVGELARSRRVLQLLGVCLQKGFTMRATSDGDFIGEFVPEGESGSITDKDLIEIKSGDLKHGIDLEKRVAPEQIIEVVEDATVVRNLWQDGFSIERVTESGVPSEGAAKYRLTFEGKAQGVVSVAFALDGNLPTKSWVKKFGRQTQTSDVVLLARVTSRHVVAIRFEHCDRLPREVRRCVFLLEISERVENTLFGPVVLPPLEKRRRRSH